MLRRYPGLLARVIAFLMAVGFASSLSEQFTPELHDGDATAAGVAFGGASQSQAPSLPSAPDHAPDAPHICHCLHVHVAWAPPSATVKLVIAEHRDGIAEHTVAPKSVIPSPHFRPPIA